MTERTRREELAWAAGFFDGEGSIGVHRTRYRTRPGVLPSRGSPYLSVNQVDVRPLQRFQAAVGGGRIDGPRQKKPTQRPIYRLDASGAQAIAIIGHLWPWFSEISREKAARAAEKLVSYWRPDVLRRGEDHPLAKLKETDIPVIRREAGRGVSDMELGRRFGVSGSSIRFVRLGRTWRHV